MIEITPKISLKLLGVVVLILALLFIRDAIKPSPTCAQMPQIINKEVIIPGEK
jgi:hypothetical protein